LQRWRLAEVRAFDDDLRAVYHPGAECDPGDADKREE